MTTRNRFILGFAAGAVIGTAAALLVAPKTGKETRHIVTNGAGQFAGQFGRKAGHYWGSLRQKISKAEGNGSGQHSADRQSEVEA